MILQQPQGMFWALLTLLITVTVNRMHMLDRYGFCHLSGWREVKIVKTNKNGNCFFSSFQII